MRSGEIGLETGAVAQRGFVHLDQSTREGLSTASDAHSTDVQARLSHNVSAP